MSADRTPLDDLRTHLSITAAMQDHCITHNNRSRPDTRAGWTAPTFEHLVLRYGITRPVVRRPKGLRKGRNRLCFMNALHRVMDARRWPDHDSEGRYTYVEGWALNYVMAHHAWIWDREADVFIDPTWNWTPKDTTLAYLGLPLKYRWLARSISRTRKYGVIYNDLTLMTEPLDAWAAVPLTPNPEPPLEIPLGFPERI